MFAKNVENVSRKALQVGDALRLRQGCQKGQKSIRLPEQKNADDGEDNQLFEGSGSFSHGDRFPPFRR